MAVRAWRTSRILFAASLAVGVVLAAGAALSVVRLQEALEAEDRRDHVLEAGDALTSRLQEAHDAARAFLRTGDEDWRQRCRAALQAAGPERATLRAALAAAAGTTRAADLDRAVGRLQDLLARIAEGGPDDAVAATQVPVLAEEAERDLRVRLRATRGELADAARAVHRMLPLVSVLVVSLLAAGAILLAAAFAGRRRAWSLAERNARHLKALLDNTPAIIQAKDLRGRYILVSRLFREFHGRAESEVLGRTPRDLLPADTAEAVLANDRATLEAGGTLTVEETFHAGGEARTFLVTKFPLRDRKGKPYGVCGISLEITDRLRAEQALRDSEVRMRTLFDQAPVAISMLRDGRHFYVNPAFVSLYALSSTQDAVGRAPPEFVPPDRRAALQERLDRFREGLPNPPDFDTVGLRRDGTTVPVHVSSRMVDFPDGQAVVAFISDMTESRRAEQEIRDFAARLERSNRDLQDYAHVASHDLKEPLRKIRMFGDRLARHLGDDLDGPAREDLDRMTDAAARMQSLVDGLLDLARVTMQSEPFVPVDLDRVARTVIADLEPAIHEAGALVGTGPLPTVQADPVQMHQLFQNLLGNALKFRVEGRAPSIRVEGRTFQATAAGDALDAPPRTWCEIRFQDNGVGFDDGSAERIFGVFQRLHGRGRYEGTGIGLAVCRRIVERHGGTIVARGRPGAGATFLVTLPMAGIREEGTA